MNRSAYLRSSLLAAALGAALSAQAVTLNIVSVGTYGFNAPPGFSYTQTENVLYSGNAPFVGITNLDLVGDGTTSIADYSSALGTLQLTFTYDSSVIVGNAKTDQGSWVATGGTGQYVNAGGSGTYSTTYNTTGQYSSTTVSGDLQAVPEPASLAALGVGALGLLRRRRKA